MLALAIIEHCSELNEQCSIIGRETDVSRLSLARSPTYIRRALHRNVYYGYNPDAKQTSIL